MHSIGHSRGKNMSKWTSLT